MTTSPKPRVFCAACTLSAAVQCRVTLSRRQGHLRAACPARQEGSGPEAAPKTRLLALAGCTYSAVRRAQPPGSRRKNTPNATIALLRSITPYGFCLLLRVFWVNRTRRRAECAVLALGYLAGACFHLGRRFPLHFQNAAPRRRRSKHASVLFFFKTRLDFI